VATYHNPIGNSKQPFGPTLIRAIVEYLSKIYIVRVEIAVVIWHLDHKAYKIGDYVLNVWENRYSYGSHCHYLWKLF
jgi:hypothetical protein